MIGAEFAPITAFRPKMACILHNNVATARNLGTVGRMSPGKLGLALIGLSLTPLAVLAYTFGSAALDESPPAPGDRITEGQRRLAILMKLTTQYISQGDAVTPAMREGKALAPVAFLNEELERRQTIFRVRSTEGTTAQTYLVTP